MGEREGSGHGGDPRVFSPEPIAESGSSNLPHPIRSPCENALSQAGGENLCASGGLHGSGSYGAMPTSRLAEELLSL